MGLITEEVEIVLNSTNIKHYEDLNYNIPRIKEKWGLTVVRGTKIKVKVNDLTKGSNAKVDVECDGCGKEIKNITWYDYKKYLRNGKYFCLQCALKLFGVKNTHKTKLENGKSFKQWCINNNRQDILDRWDYDLNDCKPDEITYSNGENYYFKCPRNLHKSELKQIKSFTRGQEGSIQCKACNSFAQWGIDNLGEDFLEKYWDWEKNNISPWEISRCANKPKVWIKCQKINYHESYDINPNSFVGVNARCPYCNKNSGKVHPLDSLGKLLEDKGLLHLWSDKNKNSPYEYPPKSNQDVYWKCLDGIHEDCLRSINNSNFYNFRCPECQYSKGEERISNYLIANDFIKITYEKYINLQDINNINNKYYTPQKEFDGLIGLGGGLLSYDFYLLKYNLLIEFQGIQHEKYIPGFHKSKKDFEIQVEHDRKKREYAQNNNIKLLEIWYYDFDNIEEILTKELFSFLREKVI